MKAVFTTKVGSGYDDVVEERYHFPSTYLSQVRNAVGDFVVYYEPRRRGDAATGGRQSYFAVARLLEIEPDFAVADHYYARLDNYLDFDRPVPFRGANGYFETALERVDGETNRGAFGRSVRNISEDEFSAILTAGFSSDAFSQIDEQTTQSEMDEPEREFERPFVEVTETRWFRDRAFTRHVQSAYNRTCAVTGLQIINGGGRAEAQAAHIRPVAKNGSDSVRNGIALSGTLHWMFDRGLITVGTDYEILAAASVPNTVRKLVNPTGRLLLPSDRAQWPHQHYLSYHRQHVYKG